MKRVRLVLASLVGTALVLASGSVLVSGSEGVPALAASRAADQTTDGPALRVDEPLLVVNKDGSAALGAYVQNDQDIELSLMGVVVWVDRQRLALNATEMWLPLPGGERSHVGSASDAGGFVVPAGVQDGTQATVEFWFDDGTCALADVTAVTRTNEHRSVYPRSGRPIGPITTDEPPAGTASC